ncbi:MAG: hypothetical protein ABSB86_08365 [Bryobacteraceae bacterium]|jgi:cytochrome c553
MSTRLLKIGLPAAILVAGFLVTVPASFGKVEYSKKEGKNCAFCHVAAGKKELNDVGKCYAEHDHSLTACAPKS